MVFGGWAYYRIPSVSRDQVCTGRWRVSNAPGNGDVFSFCELYQVRRRKSKTGSRKFPPPESGRWHCSSLLFWMCSFTGCDLIISSSLALFFCHCFALLHMVSNPLNRLTVWYRPSPRRSICSLRGGERRGSVWPCWTAPSGNKALRIMAAERGGQSIRAAARPAGRWGVFCLGTRIIYGYGGPFNPACREKMHQLIDAIYV